MNNNNVCFVSVKDYFDFLRRIFLLCSFEQSAGIDISKNVDILWTEILRCKGINYGKDFKSQN